MNILQTQNRLRFLAAELTSEARHWIPGEHRRQLTHAARQCATQALKLRGQPEGSGWHAAALALHSAAIDLMVASSTRRLDLEAARTGRNPE